MSNGYKPTPLDLSEVKLTPGQELLVDKLAENAHNVWAKDRIKQGWTYGIQQVSFWGLQSLQSHISQWPEYTDCIFCSAFMDESSYAFSPLELLSLFYSVFQCFYKVALLITIMQSFTFALHISYSHHDKSFPQLYTNTSDISLKFAIHAGRINENNITSEVSRSVHSEGPSTVNKL